MAHLLANEDGGSPDLVRQRFAQLLATMHAQQDQVGTLGAAVDHFLKVSTSFAPCLFACYEQPLIPATNNDLEHCFGSVRSFERRTTGRRGAIPGLVVRGPVRVLAALAAQAQCFFPSGLRCEDLDAWHQLRRQLAYRQEGRRRQRRFRKDPQAYLAQLETVLLKA
jgi:hypothetical protein